MNQPGWEVQEECERERYQLTVRALKAALKGTATDEQIKLLARECGVSLEADARTTRVG